MAFKLGHSPVVTEFGPVVNVIQQLYSTEHGVLWRVSFLMSSLTAALLSAKSFMLYFGLFAVSAKDVCYFIPWPQSDISAIVCVYPWNVLVSTC